MIQNDSPNGPELLRSYLKENGIKQKAFADALGIHQSNVSRVLNSTMEPTLHLAFRIEAETGGAVPARAFVCSDQNESRLGGSGVAGSEAAA